MRRAFTVIFQIILLGLALYGLVMGTDAADRKQWDEATYWMIFACFYFGIFLCRDR